MKAKLIVVLVAVSVIFVGAVLWRTDSFVYGDRMNWVEAQTRTQLSSVSHSLSVELKSLKRLVFNLKTDDFQPGKMNWNALAPYYGVASFQVNGKNLTPQMITMKQNSKAQDWNAEFVKNAVGNLANRTADQQFFIKPFQDGQRNRYVAILFLDQSKAYALFGSGEIFQSLVDAQKGSLSSFSIATSMGLTVGHSIPEYLGTMMKDDPVFQEAQKTGSSFGSALIPQKNDQDIFGMYETVPETNLVMLSSALIKNAMTGRSGLWWQFFLLGAGMVLVAVAATLGIVIPTEKKIESLEEQLANSVAAPEEAVNKVATASTAQMEEEGINKERLAAATQVSAALAHELRGPLASILGYTQMIVAKDPDAGILESTDSILREARTARGVLDKLLGYAGEEIKEKNELTIEGPLVKALKDNELLFEAKGVKVVKNFKPVELKRLDSGAVSKALTNIFENAVEAMERMPKKEMTIDIFENELGSVLEISDSGEGIEAQNLEKIFDPFFTTRAFQNHLGLGLCMAFGILKEHKAEINVESQRGQGTKLSILFKKEANLSKLPSLPQVPAAPRKAHASTEVKKVELPKAPPTELPKAPPTELPFEMRVTAASLPTNLPKVPPAPPPQQKIATMPPPPPPRDEFESEEKTVVLSSSLNEDIVDVKEESKMQAPLDVNIESLLEDLPEAVETKATTTATSTVASTVVSTVASNVHREEFTFIDGFLDNTRATPQSASAVNNLETKETVLAQTLVEQQIQEQVQARDLEVETNILPPSRRVVKKTSKLDDYKVDIRRPGKRP